MNSALSATPNAEGRGCDHSRGELCGEHWSFASERQQAILILVEHASLVDFNIRAFRIGVAMLKGLERQTDIARRHNCSLSTVRQLAMKKSFPPVMEQIGSVKFYDVICIDEFWASRVDGRRFNGRRKRRGQK